MPETMFPSEFRAGRNALGLSQAQMGVKLGGHGDRTIRKWENGERTIPPSVAALMRFFMTGDNPMLEK